MTSRIPPPIRLALLVTAALLASSRVAHAATPLPQLDHDRMLSRVAFGSCAHQDHPQPIWEQVRATKPEIFLFIGDNIYGDTRDMAVLKRKYDQELAVPGFARLRAEVPVLGTWDDHDLGENDAGGDYPFKRESQQLCLDFFGVPADSPRRKQEGVYHAEMFGPPGKRVQIILLDTRYFRSPWKSKKPPTTQDRRPYEPDESTGVTMLGEAQWTWLAEQLRQPADVRLLVSSIQVINDSFGGEKWANFPRERRRLFDLIRDTGAHGVVILSGDRHVADLSLAEDTGIGYPLYDLTSSGLTQGADAWRGPGPNTHRVAGMSWGDNFGLVLIDWSHGDSNGGGPMLSLQARDGSGDVRINEKVPLRVLQPKPPATKPTTRP
jgi:alkaline phosphatase D